MKISKKGLIWALLAMMVIGIATDAMAQRRRNITVSASESDANMFVDGVRSGAGRVEITVMGNSCVTVRAEKVGYLDEVVTFCNRKTTGKLPRTFFMEMRRDDSWDASIQTDIANIDVEVQSSRDFDDAWRIINQIVTSYIDVIEITDKETGYLRTAWEVQSFSQNTIRTRIILRLGSDDPLSFRLKLVSEYANTPQTSVKSDELFREWDRVLRKYANLVQEAQGRM